jgi:hypothetical protein
VNGGRKRHGLGALITNPEIIGSNRMSDDLWTAGTCMYKLGPVVAEGGMLYKPKVGLPWQR